MAMAPGGPEFAAINAQDLRVGDDYLAIYEKAAAGDGDLAGALQGIRAVYAGRAKCFEMETRVPLSHETAALSAVH